MTAAPAFAAVTTEHMRECSDCGLLQAMPALAAGEIAKCGRCSHVLRRAWRDPMGNALALSLGAAALLLVGASATLLSVSTVGIVHRADLFSGPVGLGDHGVWELSVVVLFTTVLAPAVKLGAMLWVWRRCGCAASRRRARESCSRGRSTCGPGR